MRTCISGAGIDNTAAWVAYMQAGRRYTTAWMYLIGEFDNPLSLWLTSWESPLFCKFLNQTFLPATVSKDMCTWEVGLTTTSCSITWSPENGTWQNQVSTTSPIQLAQNHFYDNWPVRIWKTYMPIPGDCNTLGLVEWWGGRVNTTTSGRGQLIFNCNSFLDALSQQVPANVIETTNTLAGYMALTAPPESSTPVFEAVAGSTQNVIYGDTISPPGAVDYVYDKNDFNSGYMVFLAGPGATLAGAWAAIGQSLPWTDGRGNRHNQFSIYGQLPWPPVPISDTFYVSAVPPINYGESDYYGFPWVPTPQTNV